MSSFSRRIRPHVQAELDAATAAEARGEPGTAFRHLERAHVLGQAATGLHLRVHLRMLGLAWRQRRPAEAWAQAWRSIAALVFTPVGLLPTGNTGGAGVSALRPLPVDPELGRLIDAARR
ncbi:DUF3703 domain-containing protein [Ramlibacter sp. AW1]|uniref:DUF3703 domain-containing protein n=1 Tax=Ramlibacter aurantiacus TaxID=2801330 RepID=A0A936ZFL3_9BURK|nr:DUF3703 domain-containing protein [Ramlibacter aurantiacus]MBL0420609.1 DUF3703 domain-containing protein [Ramlibacter aurantiacus]